MMRSWTPAIKEGFQAGAIARWVCRYGSVTFNLAGREFAFRGMNEAGLVIGSMEIRAGEFPEPDEAFQPYDHDTNLNVFQTLCAEPFPWPSV
jgi:penicillin V acylase-like amidase (Ntn superfamily)